jgi:phosphate transport system substrate-binding protein
VVVNPETGIASLTTRQVADLFSGQIDSWKDLGGNDQPVQVWVFSAGTDIQHTFDEIELMERSVTSEARLAASAPEMLQGVAKTPGAVGLLPRSLVKDSSVQVAAGGVFVPVLAITRSTPAGAVKDMLACLQSH